MSEAATLHAAVEPAESPLTPESWGKLGMWIFLAGDAVASAACSPPTARMRATSADWPNPSSPRHHPDRPHDLPAHLLQRHDGQGAGMAQQGDRARRSMFLFFTALGGAIFLGLQAYEWTHLIHHGLHVDGNPWGASLFGTTFFILTGFHGCTSSAA